MSNLDVLGIERRLAAITPGVWLDRGGCVSARNPQRASGDGFTLQTELTPIVSFMGAPDGWKAETADADATFIAHAPTDLRAALDEVARLTRERDEALIRSTRLHVMQIEAERDGYAESLRLEHAACESLERDLAGRGDAEAHLLAQIADLESTTARLRGKTARLRERLDAAARGFGAVVQLMDDDLECAARACAKNWRVSLTETLAALPTADALTPESGAAADAAVAEYLHRLFPVHLRYSQEGQCWFVRYPDLPGCLADGGTQEEALRNGEDAKAVWISSALKHGQSIPEPSADESECK